MLWKKVRFQILAQIKRSTGTSILFRGVRESMIKSRKRLIKVIPKKFNITEGELVTVFTLVKSLLNSRLVTNETDDPEVIPQLIYPVCGHVEVDLVLSVVDDIQYNNIREIVRYFLAKVDKTQCTTYWNEPKM